MFASLNQTVLRAVAGTLGTVILAGICLGGATAPAVAAPVSGEAPRAATVATADLNLASAKGRQTLDGRIRLAARQVCADNSDYRARSQAARCTRDAVIAARAQAYVTTAAYKG